MLRRDVLKGDERSGLLIFHFRVMSSFSPSASTLTILFLPLLQGRLQTDPVSLGP